MTSVRLIPPVLDSGSYLTTVLLFPLGPEPIEPGTRLLLHAQLPGGARPIPPPGFMALDSSGCNFARIADGSETNIVLRVPVPNVRTDYLAHTDTRLIVLPESIPLPTMPRYPSLAEGGPGLVLGVVASRSVSSGAGLDETTGEVYQPPVTGSISIDPRERGVRRIDVFACDQCLDPRDRAELMCGTEGCAFYGQPRPGLSRATLRRLADLTDAIGRTP
jgi:hypothetical protein